MPSVSLRVLALSGLALGAASAPLAQTSEPPMMRALATDGSLWFSFPLFTIGEAVNGYQPPGSPDGIGAWELNDQTIRFVVNHELGDGAGFPYEINNGQLLLTGARISSFDVNRRTLEITHAEEAYEQVVDRYGDLVTTAQQVNEGTDPLRGFNRFCSSAYFSSGQYGLVDDLYFAGEEIDNGQAYVLDPRTQTLHAVPALGRTAFENVTLVDTGDPSTVGVVIGSDRGRAPLYLYIGTKNPSGDLLDRNGLATGNLYVWVAEDATSPEDFNGTGSAHSGSFVRVTQFNPALAGEDGYDEAGYADMETLDAQSAAVGAFEFSRLEDVATNPADGTEVVIASTGLASAFPSDAWGTTYVVDFNFTSDVVTADVEILYDGDDAGDGQFASPDAGLRNPDNLTWAQNGIIYVQEDRAVDGFGLTTGDEASVWAVDPTSGELERIGMMDRSAVPSDQTDSDPTDIGNWESSGVIDVSETFGLPAPITLLMLAVQAHSIGDGVIADNTLSEGGQLVFMLGIPGTSPLADTLESQNPGSLVEALALIAGQLVADEDAFGLESAFPNPFASLTTVRYTTTEAGPLAITAFDALGRVVATLVDEALPARTHEATFDAADLPSGIYVLRMVSAEGTQTLRLTLVR